MGTRAWGEEWRAEARFGARASTRSSRSCSSSESHSAKRPCCTRNGTHSVLVRRASTNRATCETGFMQLRRGRCQRPTERNCSKKLQLRPAFYKRSGRHCEVRVLAHGGQKQPLRAPRNHGELAKPAVPTCNWCCAHGVLRTAEPSPPACHTAAANSKCDVTQTHCHAAVKGMACQLSVLAHQSTSRPGHWHCS